MICPSEKRIIGVLIHHVASSYPFEVNLIQTIVSGKAIEGIIWGMVDKMNSEHANTQAKSLQSETVAILKKNSSLVADSVCFLHDEQLDYLPQISLNWDALLTTQYFIEEHLISQSCAHLASVRSIINSTP